MKIISVALIAVSAFAQPAVFPGAVVTDTQLGIAKNITRAQLSNQAGLTDTTFNVTNSSCVVNGYAASCATAFVPNMFVVLDNEAVIICGVVPGSATTALKLGASSCPNIDGRGWDSTVIATHNAAIISSIQIAKNHNQLAKEVEAIETSISTSGSTSSYNFSQAPGGSIAIGASTVILTPCPQGVNSTDSNHYLYLSNGGGAAESVLITGGTCTAGAATGTVTFTAANAHAGQWTISSATCGGQEAIQAFKATGGTISYPPGQTCMLHAAPVVYSNIILSGSGSAILKIPNGEYNNTLNWFAPGQSVTSTSFYGMVVTAASGTSDFSVRDITLDFNGANQIFNASPSTIIGIDSNRGTIQNVKFLNPINGTLANQQALGIAILGFTTSESWLMQSNTMIGIGGCTPGIGPGFIFAQGLNHRIIGNTSTNNCTEVYVANNSRGIKMIGNHWTIGTGKMGSTFVIYHAEDSIQTAITGNSCDASNAVDPDLVPNCVGAQGVLVGTSDTTIADNLSYFCNSGIYIGPNPAAVTLASGTTVSGGEISNSRAQGIFIAGPSKGISIRGVSIHDSRGMGINIVTQGATAGLVQSVVISGNYINHNGTATAGTGAGIQIFNSADSTAKQAQDIYILNNPLIGDLGTSATQSFGINITGTGQCLRCSIQFNGFLGNITLPLHTGNPSLNFGGTFVESMIGPNYDGTVTGSGIFNFSKGDNSIENGSVVASSLQGMDFHTSGNNVDFDSRIVCQGGGATAGTGACQWVGGILQVSGGANGLGYFQVSKYCATGVSGCPVLPGVPAATIMVYCADCTTAAICVTGGTGHLAVSNGTNWTCQ